jgi:hypothetical protein
MSKTATEMFEKLGFIKKYYRNGSCLCYEKGYFSVYFEINKKTYNSIDQAVIDEIAEITPQLHKAIHKQLEELGWLDEDNE